MLTAIWCEAGARQRHAVTRWLAIPLAALTIALGLVWFVHTTTAVRGPAFATDDAPLAPQAEPNARHAELVATAPRSAVTLRELAPEVAPRVADSTSSTWVVRGVVLDPRGAPVPGLVVSASAPGARDLGPPASSAAPDARSDVEGRFELSTSLVDVELFAEGAGYGTVYCGLAEAEYADDVALIVVARTARAAGHVVNQFDVPVQGAALTTYDARGPGLPGFPLPLDRSRRVAPTWTTDRTGAFDLGALPFVAGRRVDVKRAGHSPTYFVHGLEDRLDWILTLGRYGEVPPGGFGLVSEPTLFGEARLHDGRPAEGARVFLAGQSAVADKLGRWEFERPGFVPVGAVLAATLGGAGHALIEDPEVWTRGIVRTGGSARIGPIRMTLAQETFALRGRVIDADGAPLAGWEVRLVDATFTHPATMPSPSLERGLHKGAAWPTTDVNGAFELARLCEREYLVKARDPHSFVSVEAVARAGDRALVLQLPRDAVATEVLGRVVDGLGAPVAGVSVHLATVLERTAVAQSGTRERRARTDTEGRFVLAQLPRRGVTIELSGPTIDELSVSPPPGGFGDAELELRVTGRVQARVDWAAHEPRPDAVEFLDSAGRCLQARVATADARATAATVELTEGRSPVLTLPDGARTALLRRTGVELARVPLELRAGVVNVVRSP